MREPFLKRDISDAIKGVALIMMYVHHLFTWPDWRIESIAYPEYLLFARLFNSPLKLCVPVFAFLSGYFYHFTVEKSLRYSLRKMTDLLIPHFIVCVLMMIPAAVFGTYELSVSSAATELMGLGIDVMCFSWYVSFYCASMLLLPVITRLSAGNLLGDIVTMLALPVIGAQIISIMMERAIPLDTAIPAGILGSIQEWFPCIISGYVFAKYALFETWLDNVTDNISGKAGKIFFWLCLCAAGFLGRLAIPRFRLDGIQIAGDWTELVFLMDVVYAPLFVYGMVRLLEMVKIPAFLKCLRAIGQKSMYMWFLHAMFFNSCKEFIQPVVYAPRNPVLVLIWALAICYALASVIDKMMRPLLKVKKKII